MSAETDTHKQHAVDLHHRQAPEFESRYKALADDPYSSTFTYGRMKIEALLERELGSLPPGAKVLDVGCGTGFNVRRLRERGFDAMGLEPAEGMRARALEDNPGKIVDGDGENLPFEDGTFDFVLSIEVIRYLADPVKSLREMRRVLKPGGTAFVTAAPKLSLNGYALINLVTSRIPVPSFTKVKHTFTTEPEAHRQMKDAGFARSEVHGAFLGPWHALGRVSPAALGVVLRAAESVDDTLSDLPILRNFANHLVIVGRR